MSHAVAKVLRGMAFDWIVGAAAVVVADVGGNSLGFELVFGGWLWDPDTGAPGADGPGDANRAASVRGNLLYHASLVGRLDSSDSSRLGNGRVSRSSGVLYSSGA